jgi:hypothetical protein
MEWIGREPVAEGRVGDTLLPCNRTRRGCPKLIFLTGKPSISETAVNPESIVA